MAILIVNNLEHPQGLVLDGRVLIGRRPFNRISIPDPAVSRIHAWVGQREGRFVLFDAGSRSGTIVNDSTVAGPHFLADGDEIRVGPAIITYFDVEQLPEEVAPIKPAPPLPAADPYDGGIYFDCECGGPMWVGAELAGAVGKCRYCGKRLVVPQHSGQMARPVMPAPAVSLAERRALKNALQASGAPIAPPPELPAALCSICQTAIQAGEARTSCPSCHLTFHAQCWQENFGCSAYGCDQVNVLAPASAPTNEAPATQAPLDYAEAPPPHAFPWELVLLALSFVGTLLGALAFGVPAAIMLIWSIFFLARRKPAKKGLVVTAAVVAAIGILAGIAVSMFWWKGVRIWEMGSR